MPNTECHDELDCVTGGAAMLSALVDEAWELPSGNDSSGDAEGDLRRLLPGLLAQLPDESLALLGDQFRHVTEIVAFVHRATAAIGGS